MSFIKEFKEFISKGNVIDLAVGVVIGGAFTSIVTSLTQDIFTPILSVITGKIDISTLAITVSDELTIPYGLFLQSILNFLLTAVAVFALVKFVNSFRKKMELLHKKEEEEEKEEAKPSEEVLLLTEIRDLLSKE